jgi:LPS-assembly protein
LSAFLLLIVSIPDASAQIFRPPPVAPPPSATQANPANPNQKVRVPRPNAPGPNDVNADATQTEVVGSVRHLRGNVRLETSEMMLQADEVDYDVDTGDAEARGNVKFEHYFNGDRIECDHAEYNLNEETGKFYQVRGTSPAKIESRPGILTTSNPFYFEGDWAERIHEKYVLHNGFITDCKVPRPWWILKGPRFDVFPGDHAVAYHATYRVRNVPLFYAPALYKSLKKVPRKSGFLTPNAGHSSLRGYMVGAGYYWAINRSYDAMYRAQYFTQRGLAHTADFRGKVRPGTDFNVSMYAVNDRGLKIGTDAAGKDIIQKQGGELVSFQARSDLGHGWLAKVEVNYLSSFLFRQSFTESFHDAIFSESRSVGFVGKHWSSFGFTVEADRDEQFQSVAPDDKIIIRHLPQAEFVSRDHQIWDKGLPVWVSFTSSAGLLSRTEPDFQTRTFVPRVDINPRITTALHWAGFSLVPSFSARETQYGSSFVNGVVSGQNYLRSSRELSVEVLAPSLARIYKAPKWMGEKAKLKHVIESRAEYRYVTGVSDFNKVVRFDATDLVSDTNEARFSLANRFYLKGDDGNVNEVMSWELSHARYFDPSFGGAIVAGRRNIVESEVDITGYAFLDQPRHYSPVVSVLRVQEKIGLEWRTDYDPVRHSISNSGFTADYRWEKYFISLGHYDVKSDPLLSPSSNQFRGLIGFGNQNRKGWNAAFSSYYDFKRGLVQFSTLEATYNTDCCGISVEYRRFNIGTRDETQYRVAFAISNVGTFGTLKKQERIF